MNLVLGALAGFLVWILIEWSRATAETQRALHAWGRECGGRAPGPIAPLSEHAALRTLDDLVGDDLERARNVAIHLVRDTRFVVLAAQRFGADPKRMGRLDRLGARVAEDERLVVEDATGNDDEWLRDRRQTRQMAWKCMIKVFALADDEHLLTTLLSVARDADATMRPHVVRVLALSGNLSAARCAANVAEEWRDEEDSTIRGSWTRRPRNDSSEYLRELANVARRATSLNPTGRAWLLWQAGELDREWQVRLGLTLPFDGEDILNHLRQLALNGATPIFDDLVATWERVRAEHRDAAEQNPQARFLYRRAVGHVATLAGRTNDERAAEFIRGLSEEVGEEQVELADGLLGTAGLPRLFSIGGDENNTRSSPERLAELVLNLDTEVCHGGFARYFLNTTGEQWQETIRVLEQISAPSCARLLKSAAMILGGAPALSSETARSRAIGRLSQSSAKKLDSLSSNYHGRTEPLFVRAADWILQHVDQIPEERRAALAAMPR